jgi:Tol biopolymer transport system component
VISTSIVAMEPGGNKIAGTSPQVVDTFVGTFPVWSPDGKQMAFTRARPDGSDANLVVRTLDTGNERIYSQDGIRTAPARWFPDGKSLIKNGALPGADSGALYRLNLGTGEYATIAKFGNSLGGGESEVSADGKTAYLAGRDPATGNLGRLMAVDIATGTSRTIFTSPVGGNLQRFALSPAGDQFLLRIEVADNKNSTSYLATVGVNGNGYREFYRTGTQITGIAWTSDAKGALFAARPESQWQVLRVPIAGGQPEPTGLVVESADSRVLLSLNRDGTRLAASSRKLVWEIWELEHLTSALK